MDQTSEYGSDNDFSTEPHIYCTGFWDSTEIVHLRRVWNGIRAAKFEYPLESIWNSTKIDRISPISVGTEFFLQIESQSLDTAANSKTELQQKLNITPWYRI
jgi:hypothetical protein